MLSQYGNDNTREAPWDFYKEYTERENCRIMIITK